MKYRAIWILDGKVDRGNGQPPRDLLSMIISDEVFPTPQEAQSCDLTDTLSKISSFGVLPEKYVVDEDVVACLISMKKMGSTRYESAVLCIHYVRANAWKEIIEGVL